VLTEMLVQAFSSRLIEVKVAAMVRTIALTTCPIAASTAGGWRSYSAVKIARNRAGSSRGALYRAAWNSSRACDGRRWLQAGQPPRN
jgi:hypothetical protein